MQNYLHFEVKLHNRLRKRYLPQAVFFCKKCLFLFWADLFVFMLHFTVLLSENQFQKESEKIKASCFIMKMQKKSPVKSDFYRAIF